MHCVRFVLFAKAHATIVESHAVDRHGLAGNSNLNISIGISHAKICGAGIESKQFVIALARFGKMLRLRHGLLGEGRKREKRSPDP
ncbi:hypothetical protein [Brucella cytisi]|uniref:hypothetical protein n=1 Tax=Brucella cytisi TaxID=407152 RepID=UPI0011607CC6|nr:hypothetical protein [Brucella cytisi]